MKWIRLCSKGTTQPLMVINSCRNINNYYNTNTLWFLSCWFLTGLTWFLYLLAKHPEHQDKCREEVQNVLRGKKHLD